MEKKRNKLVNFPLSGSYGGRNCAYNGNEAAVKQSYSLSWRSYPSRPRLCAQAEE